MGQPHAAAGHLRERSGAASAPACGHILKQFPEVRSVVSKAGRPEDGTDPKQINMAEFLVDLIRRSEWKRKITKEELLRADAEEPRCQVPGYRAELFAAHSRQRPRKHFADRRPDRHQGLRRRYRRTLKNSAEQVLDQRLARSAAWRAPSSTARAQCRSYRSKSTGPARRALRPKRGRRAERDRDRARRQGGHRDLGGRAQISRSWSVSQKISAPTSTIGTHPRSIRPRACACRWSDVATLSVRGGSMNIAHESGKRLASIGVFLRGRDMGSAVEEMQHRVEQNVTLAARLLPAVGRRIREPAARHGAAARHRAHQHLPHLPAAVPRLRLGEERRRSFFRTSRSRWSAASSLC